MVIVSQAVVFLISASTSKHDSLHHGKAQLPPHNFLGSVALFKLVQTSKFEIDQFLQNLQTPLCLGPLRVKDANIRTAERSLYPLGL